MGQETHERFRRTGRDRRIQLTNTYGDDSFAAAFDLLHKPPEWFPSIEETTALHEAIEKKETRSEAYPSDCHGDSLENEEWTVILHEGIWSLIRGLPSILLMSLEFPI